MNGRFIVLMSCAVGKRKISNVPVCFLLEKMAVAAIEKVDET
ncbi:MAG: hypothetical protein ACI92Z_002649 [Paracoccaceae bacterium]|jgi:hypothetical protein